MSLTNFISIGTDIASARAAVEGGLYEAIETMQSMIGNEGQQSILDSYVIPEFQGNLGPIQDGWEEIDIGDYMDFMGDIVGEGNDIMTAAYEEAQDILSEIEEYLEEFGEDIGEDI